MYIEGFPDEYSFWKKLPSEWAIMKDVINACVDYARLDKRLYKCGVSAAGRRKRKKFS